MKDPFPEAARRRSPSTGDSREDALLTALETLLAEGRPLASVPVDQIAGRAGVSRTTFYFYFRSKESALEVLARLALAKIWLGAGEWLEGEAEFDHALRSALAAATAEWDAHHAVMTAVVDASTYDAGVRAFWIESVREFAAAITGRIERDVAAGVAPPGLDPACVAQSLCWMAERVCYVNLGPGPERRAPEQVGEQLYAVFRRAIYGP